MATERDRSTIPCYEKVVAKGTTFFGCDQNRILFNLSSCMPRLGVEHASEAARRFVLNENATVSHIYELGRFTLALQRSLHLERRPWNTYKCARGMKGNLDLVPKLCLVLGLSGCA
ncbi:hypothetical protein BN126360070 [Stenotrophomonas indicatrix]|nr:hypothetical protein BN126360070 [Stenotrophomonas indicatrix]